MWTRKELKSKAKESLKRNYWKTVLIALVFTVVCSGAGAVGAASGGGTQTNFTYTGPSETQELSDAEIDQMLEDFNEVDMTDIDNPPVDETLHLFELAPSDDGEGIVGEIAGNPVNISRSEFFAVTGVMFVITVIVLAIALTISAFVTNPVEVGTARFFTRNLNQPAAIGEVTFGFDYNYLQTVKTMFWRDVRILLWGLLLVIPGVVKSYEYRMIPYLLAEDPTLSTDEAFAQSKRMMSGNKWRAFVLDLSFIGWALVTLFTFGLANVFFVAPYKKMTDAALYEALRYGQAGPQDHVVLPAPAPAAASSAPVPTPVSTSDMDVPVPPFAAADAPAPMWDDAADGEGPQDGPVVPGNPQA